MAYTLYYHEGKRGFVEKIRILLADTGLKYKLEEVDAAGFEKLKKEQVVSFGMLPVLKAGSIVVENSTNILEFLANEADKQRKGGSNKYSGEPAEAPVVRGYAAAAEDFQMAAGLYLGKESVPENFLGEIMPKWFTFFQDIILKNDDGDVRTEEWTYGKHLTYADVAIFEAVNSVASMFGTGKLRPYPKLKEFHDAVAGRGRIDHYLSTRPEGY